MLISIDDYIKAGRIAAEVREHMRKRYHVGRTLLEICEEAESMIRARGGEPAFPCNVSLNEVAAHYTAEPDDSIEVRDGDILKIDIGVHVNGSIADTAVTVCYNPSYSMLVEAAEHALREAVRVARVGTKASDIGRVIEHTIRSYGLKPIQNLSGHSIASYTIHAGKSIPNIWTIGSFALQQGEVYAIEPFVTTGDGSGVVYNGDVSNIYSLVTRKRTGDKDADEFINMLWDRFRTLPFALRWLRDKDLRHARDMLAFLLKKKIVRAYPVLVEGNERYVAQAEHTMIPTNEGTLVITA
ncbi:MAG: type II methionyl aminopeptidase [Candidatus Nitrosocaldus sp.]|nr:type II methionyl aminopeptidase [Candidatus Nitrosocaldus sp.]MDW8000412.1 type II methionyl aminopeptidase [Candidatus Nitrosocaldus sp.]